VHLVLQLGLHELYLLVQTVRILPGFVLKFGGLLLKFMQFG
jgi:hypothetical protein